MRKNKKMCVPSERTFFVSPKNNLSISVFDFLYAIFADELAVEALNVVSVAAENAGRLILFENNGFAIDIDFDSVLLRDVKRAAQLDGQNNSAELVDLSDNTC